MMQPGTIPFWTSDGPDAADQAKEFCRTRGLTSETAKIVKKGDAVMVEIKKACKLKVVSDAK